MQMHIAAKDVVAGDRLYNNSASRPEFRWVRVVGVRKAGTATTEDRIVIVTPHWETWKHPLEGVFIERET